MTKTTAATNQDSGVRGQGRDLHCRRVVGKDTYQFSAATELQAGDNLVTGIIVPSNAVIEEVAIFNDDMDTHACAPTLVLDVGLAAFQDHSTVTSGTVTKRLKDDVIDSDILVDGATTGRAATTNWTILTPINGPEKALKRVWELLGYDSDPRTSYRILVQSQAAAAALSSAADLSIRVVYSVEE